MVEKLVDWIVDQDPVCITFGLVLVILALCLLVICTGATVSLR